MSHEHQMIEINLNAPKTPEGYEMHTRNYGENFVDETIVPRHQQLTSWSPTVVDDDKPHIRFYSIGPSTYQILCPLCKKRADTETVQMRGALGQLSCLLSMFSCCFPIFSLSFIYVLLQNRLKSKRYFCNKCGGYLGSYWRPT